MANLAYYENDCGDPIAVLLDFDLAVMPSVELPKPHPFGTVVFMARDYLMTPSCEYRVEHDVESLYYCAIWHGLGYESSSRYPRRVGSNADILERWRVGEYKYLALMKSAHIGSKIMDYIFDYIPDASYVEKCKQLREVYRDCSELLLYTPASMSRYGEVESILELDLATPEDPLVNPTVPLILQALGVDSQKCEEECCWQLCRRPIKKVENEAVP